MYVDEALFQARIHPERPAGSLDDDEIRRLHRAIRDRLAAAVEAGGASIDSYRDSLGQRGSMQDLLRVHLHEGDPCPRCRTTIVKTRVAGRGTYWCPHCQPEPPPW
jgi:formamidopyrimidine-DNA glycosylase